MKEIAPQTYLIDTQYVREGFNAVYLVVCQGKGLLVDCGTAHSVCHIEKAIAEVGLSWEQLDTVVLTHVHLDHAAGSGLIMQKAKNAKLYVHPRGYRHLIDPTKLIAGTQEVYASQPIEELFGKMLACPEERLIQAENNQEIDFFGRKFLIHHSPGHAKHHLSLLDLKQRIYFSGDSTGVCYRRWDRDKKIFAFLPTVPNQFEPEIWKKTIQEIRHFNPQKICLTHFGITEQVNSLLSQIENLLDKFVALALKHKDFTTKRKQTITSDLLELLFSSLMEEDSSLEKTEIKEWFSKDIYLAAFGLDHWLSIPKK